MKFSIQFKIKDKIHEIQTEFDYSEEKLNSTLNKMYQLLDQIIIKGYECHNIFNLYIFFIPL